MSDAMTRLTEKAHSPLLIRKYTKWGFPIYVGLITDDNLNELDKTVKAFMSEQHELWKSDRIQDKRTLAGLLTDFLAEAFERQEGVAVVLFVDKCCISSLRGDFMNHAMCRDEFYSLLNMSTAV